MTEYRQQWQVPSSDGKRTYTVSVTVDGVWSCSCIGWTRHMPRRDCKHIKRERQTDRGSETQRGATGSTPGVSGSTRPVSVAPAPTVKSALKAGANREEAADVARIKREDIQAKKTAKLGRMRYGFQLAHTYDPSDLSRGRWVAEVKYDGELGMLIDGRLVNRSGNDITHRFPEIEKAVDAVFVGEIVVLDASGQSHFNKIQERNTDDPMKIRAMSESEDSRATFMAFDILEDEEGNDLTDRPLSERRASLEAFFETERPPARVKLTEQLPVESDSEVQALVDACRKRETEGIMLKNLDAPYVASRTRNWVKAKTWQEREFDVVRFEDTGIGDGFVVYVRNKGREQRVNCGSFQMRQKIRAGHKRVEVKFLSESEDGAMRFPSLRRLV